VKKTVTGWLNGLTADFYDGGVFKLVLRLDKCLRKHILYILNKAIPVIVRRGL
jgi:hypothetical protein